MTGGIRLTWADCINDMLRQDTFVDGMQLQEAGHGWPCPVPPLIKASLLMLSRMKSGGGRLNAFVFPERTQTAFLLALLMVLQEISEKQIGGQYDPHQFVPDEHLQFDGHTVAFVRMEGDYIYVKTSTDTFGLPLETAPFFQHVTYKKLCRQERFSKLVREVIDRKRSGQLSSFLEELQDNKTHLQGTVYFLSQVNSAKKLLLGTKIGGCAAQDLLLLGQAGSDGKIQVYGRGAGTPTFVVTNSFYAIDRASEKTPAHAVVVDITSQALIEQQLSDIDRLIRKGIPLIFISDFLHYDALEHLISRGCEPWFWDKDCLTESLRGDISLATNHRVDNCMCQSIETICCDDMLLSESVQLLFQHKKLMDEASVVMQTIFDRLMNFAFSFLRRVIPFTESEKEKYRNDLAVLESKLSSEQHFLAPEVWGDFSKTIRNLRFYVSGDTGLPKAAAFERFFEERSIYERICVLLHDRDKACAEAVQKRLRRFARTDYMSVSDFLNMPDNAYSTIVFCGWYGASAMNRVIQSFAAPRFILFIYGCERGWYNANRRQSERVHARYTNQTVARRLFGFVAPPERQKEDQQPETPDELDAIELTIRTNRYRRYGGTGAAGETTDAVPVSFVGDFLSFYRIGHQVVSITGIINATSEKIEMKTPDKLQIGDFVVVRDSQHDLLCDIADKKLAASGKGDARAIAKCWQEALKLQCSFYGENATFNALKSAGCNKQWQTIRSWLTDDEKISPQDKEDLQAIADVTQDDILLEYGVDEVYNAGREVVSAHILAGKALSQRLRRQLPDAIQSMGEIDVFNIWEPLQLDLEDVGRIRILKVIDIGAPVQVETANTGKLIEAWEE